MIYEIIKYPDPILKKKAEPVDKVEEKTKALIDDMVETMYNAPGIGLAANQIGILKRIIVFETSLKREICKPAALINPEIVLAEGEIVTNEACLSILDYSADVKRFERIKVRGLSENGDEIEIEADGQLAVCLQHEMDHLDGILYIDLISSLKRNMYKKRLKKKLLQEDSG